MKSASEVYAGFAAGALSTLCVVSALALWRFVRAPSVDDIEEMATKPLPHMGDDDIITLYGLQEEGENPGWKQGVTDASPFVIRVEAFLRLIRKPYLKLSSKGGFENPRRKVPYANIEGSMVDDSGRIIEALKNKFAITIDDDLSQEQHATGYMLQQLLCGSLYWVQLHQAFNTRGGRKVFAKNMQNEPMPGFVKALLIPLVIKTQNENLYGCGIGRMPHSEIINKGKMDLRVISTVLGTNKFMLGTPAPTSYDTDVYAFLVALFRDEVQCENVWVKEIKDELHTLSDYVDRMRNILYPESSQ